MRRSISTRVTKVAMMRTYAGMRTLSGMTLRRRETNALEHTNTTVAASPIPSPLNALVEMASVGHIPSTSLNTGLEAKMPFVTILPFPFMLNFNSCGMADFFMLPPPRRSR